jgi:hypothetical protein
VEARETLINNIENRQNEFIEIAHKRRELRSE